MVMSMRVLKHVPLLLVLLPLATSCDEDRRIDALQAQAVLPNDSRISFPPAQLPRLTLANGKSLAVESVLNVPRRMTYGDFSWEDNGIPPGPLLVVVDLAAQTISVFQGGHEIGAAVTLFGADEKPTPTGRFTVLARRKDHWSASYDAPMPYMLRLTDDGVAIHGSSVLPGAATHGCIGVPLEFARRLFERARVGDEVVILRNGRAAIASEASAT